MTSSAPVSEPFGLVVPVYNESKRVDIFGTAFAQFAATLAPGSELLFVDDGSKDDTGSRIEALQTSRPDAPLRLLRREHEGKGAAVAAGLRSLDTPVRGFCDVDLSTPLEDLAMIAEQAIRGGGLAIGSRDLVGSELIEPEGALREMLGRIYNRVLQATVTPGVVDTQCGAKAATVAVWEQLLKHSTERGFAWDAEVVAIAIGLGIEVQEVPIRWRHDDGTRVRVLRDGASMLFAIPRIAGSRREAEQARAKSLGTETFDDPNARRLLEADRTHWWFRCKAALVATALERVGSTSSSAGWLIDAGGGSGGVTTLVGWRPDRIVLIDGNHTLARAAKERHGLTSAQASLKALPVGSATARTVLLLDVIEHTHEPVNVLREARRALSTHGFVVVTVPAHPWLWSRADEELGHVRRYTRRRLRAELAESHLEPVMLTHVFSWLVVPTWLARRVVHRDRAEFGLRQRAPFLDVAASALTWCERHLLGRISLPFGTTILCVARRAPSDGSPTAASKA